MARQADKVEQVRTFMGRLARDARGNTLAMMAAAMIPMVALAGSAVDTARLYVVKVRLQQACDAGALAARKTMANDGSSNLDATATAQGKAFFANNFVSGYMGTATYTSSTNPYPFTPTKTADQQVAATATVAVPMTLMKMFGQPSQPITVTCQARYDVADTDVMFVLDTTGSMACGPSDPDSCGQATVSYQRSDGTTGYKVSEKSNSRISALRSAVLSFYDTVAATADTSTHVRYGFVPYTSAVNAGYAVTALSTSYMVSTWKYNTRHIVGDYYRNAKTNYGTYTNVNQTTCAAYNNLRSPSTGYNTDGSATMYYTSWTSASGGTCTVQTQTLSPTWRYESWPLDVSQLITGAAVTDPTKITGATSKWQGCVEERDTTPGTMTFNQTSLPPDLDPDLIPSSDATRWRPMWTDVVYARTNATSVDDTGTTTNPYGDNSIYGYYNITASNSSSDATFNSTVNTPFNQLTDNRPNPDMVYLQAGYMVCGKAVQRLTTMARSDVSNYVNSADFVPWGGTYHDTGMIWGTRMIAPAGIFGADTAAWPGRQTPNRYIVFMTDGHMSTNQTIYGAYGWENYDKRTTGGDFSNDDAYHNARFLAECQAAKNRNIKVFVVTLAATLDSNLTTCASPNSAYYASDSASLTAAFQTIAKQVAMLRISQ